MNQRRSKTLVTLATACFFISYNCLAIDRVSSDTVLTEIEKSRLLSDSEGPDLLDTKPKIGVLVTDNTRKDSIKKTENLAYLTSVADQYEASVELYKTVLQSEKKNTDAQFALGILYQKLGQNRQAKKIYKTLLKSGIDASMQEQVTANLLGILVDESPRESVYLLDRLSIQNPHSPYILAQAGIAYSAIGSYEKSVSLLQRALDLDPENPQYLFNMGVSYDKMGDKRSAIQSYQDALSTNSKTNSDLPSLIPIDMIQKRIQFLRASTNKPSR